MSQVPPHQNGHDPVALPDEVPVPKPGDLGLGLGVDVRLLFIFIYQKKHFCKTRGSRQSKL